MSFNCLCVFLVAAILFSLMLQKSVDLLEVSHIHLEYAFDVFLYGDEKSIDHIHGPSFQNLNGELQA